MSREALLEMCRRRGLKATGWKKGRMAEELAVLLAGEGAAPDGAEPPAGERAGQSGRETTPGENPEARPRLSGWCGPAPMWSGHHAACRWDPCECACHADDWEAPAAPEGAALSKFNPDRPPSVI